MFAVWHTFAIVREASHIDFVHEKRHMDVLLEISPPPTPLETSRTFFDTAETPETLFFLQVISGLSDVHKSLKVHLRAKT